MDELNYDKTATEFDDFEQIANAFNNNIMNNCYHNVKPNFNEFIYRHFDDFTEAYFHKLTIKKLKELCEIPQFNSYFKCIKQNRLKNIEIPYDEQIFNDFVHSEISYRSCEYSHQQDYLISLRKNTDDEHCIEACAMLYDAEFAYTEFYSSTVFQQFEPFIEYKQNYNERKERLLMVYEELYDNYTNGNNMVETVFCNDYLVRMVLRFL